MRSLLLTLLVVTACQEDRAALDRAEQADRHRVKRLDEQAPLELAYAIAPEAAQPAEPPPPRFGPGAQMFVDAMSALLPSKFCEASMYFRQCFTIDEAECKRRVAEVMPACIREHAGEMPEQLDAESGRRAGATLGSCAGTRYEIALAAEGRRLDRAECNDLDRWR